jgi:DNA-binding MarR family transcriptional regulator
MVLLPRLAKQVMRRTNADALGMDLRLLMALSYLGDHDGAPQQELVDALCMDAKNIVLLLNELEDGGYLVRQRDTEDRRRHRVHITAAGREALDRASRVLDDIEDEVLRALDAEERATLWDLLRRRPVRPDGCSRTQLGLEASVAADHQICSSPDDELG